MVRDGVLVYIYTVGGRTVKWQNQWEGGVAVRGGWMHNGLWRGEVYKCVCVGITVVYLAAVSYSSVYVSVASRTC
jgi:hypothetical protein